ncbi:hypothetical protein D3C80_1330740 [compost metagenome]
MLRAYPDLQVEIWIGKVSIIHPQHNIGIAHPLCGIRFLLCQVFIKRHSIPLCIKSKAGKVYTTLYKCAADTGRDHIIIIQLYMVCKGGLHFVE